MELSFNKGNYDQHMNMVNASKELLNDSIVLRSIKENIDQKIEESREDDSGQNFILILIIAIPLFILVGLSLYFFGITWRVFPGVGLIGFILVYFNISKDGGSHLNPHLHSSQILDDNPKPLKFLEMKVNYLLSITKQRDSQLQLLRAYYWIFFPFVLYYSYELLIKETPFNHLLIGIILAFLMNSIAWYLFFQNDFKALGYSEKQLNDYNKLIQQHYLSYSDQEE